MSYYQSKVMASDGQVKAGPGVVTALVIATAGATAGDIIVLRDGGATGPVKVRAHVVAATATLTVPLGSGIAFGSTIYYSELAAAAGKIWTTVIHD